MSVVALPDQAVLRVEIDRSFREWMTGRVLVVAPFALAALLLAHFMFRLMHQPGAVAVQGTIVEVVHEGDGGWMTSEFPDIDGHLARDRQSFGYHYAFHDPVVGEPIGYAIWRSPYTGEAEGVPRTDRLLTQVFAGGGLLLGAMVLGAFWMAWRRRRLRLHLLRVGVARSGAGYEIETRSVTLPGAGGQSLNVRNWRLRARDFLPAQAAFRDCRSEWQPLPAPELQAGTPVSPILMDPERPARYWLPVGELRRAK